MMAFGLARALVFTWSTGARPWFDPMLAIDGNSYLAGMVEIVDRTGPLDLTDIYHSPGYQIYLAGFYFLRHDAEGAIVAVKLAAWALQLLCVVLVVLVGRRSFTAPAGLGAGVLVAFSHSLACYANLIQYEVPLAFLILAHTAGLLTFPLVPRRRLRGALFFLLGLTAAAAALIQDRFILLVPIGAFCLWLAQRDARRLVLAYLIPAMLILGGWAAYQTRRTGAPTLISSGAGFRFRIHNNPNAVGEAFPYVEPVEPSGWRFVISRPGRYVWLVKERFLYLWDLKKDLWYLGVPGMRGGGASAFQVFAVCIFGAGLAMKARSDARSGRLREHAALYLTLFCSWIGPLLVLSSSRYNVPVIPILALFQAEALTRASAFCRERLKSGGLL
ncbi:MAG: hypothetical protein WC881_08645 [Elusimicrobiota bacterium]